MHWYLHVLIDELKSFRYVVKIDSMGKSKIGMTVPSGKHDDTVMAVALACHDLRGKLDDPEKKTPWDIEFAKDEDWEHEQQVGSRFHY